MKKLQAAAAPVLVVLASVLSRRSRDGRPRLGDHSCGIVAASRPALSVAWRAWLGGAPVNCALPL